MYIDMHTHRHMNAAINTEISRMTRTQRLLTRSLVELSFFFLLFLFKPGVLLGKLELEMKMEMEIVARMLLCWSRLLLSDRLYLSTSSFCLDNNSQRTAGN